MKENKQQEMQAEGFAPLPPQGEKIVTVKKQWATNQRPYAIAFTDQRLEHPAELYIRMQAITRQINYLIKMGYAFKFNDQNF